MRAFRSSLWALIGTVSLTVLVGCDRSTSSPADSEAGLKEVEKMRSSEMGKEMQDKMGMTPGKPGDPSVEQMKKKMMGGQEGAESGR